MSDLTLSLRDWIYRLRKHPRIFYILLTSGMLIVVSASYLLFQYFSLENEIQLIQTSLADDRFDLSANRPLPKKFHDEDLSNKLVELSSTHHLAIEEIHYNIEDLKGPGLYKYQAIFNVSAEYPNVSNFISAINSRQEYRFVEKLSCSKGRIDVSEVQCEIVVSGIYTK